MSVAFRRDSDEEHLEPKFELPLPAGPNRVTARGLALIAQRIADLEAELAAELARTPDPAAADPVIRAALQRDLRYWNTRQITAELAPVPSGDKVELGTQVSVRLNGKPR
ncbi:MAG: nucleoside-diphosphate kinase, partial [Croceibacterium sp.]